MPVIQRDGSSQTISEVQCPYILESMIWPLLSDFTQIVGETSKSYGLTLLKFGKQVEMRLKQIQSDVCIHLASGLLLLCIWIYLYNGISVHPSQDLVPSNEITGKFTDRFWQHFQEKVGVVPMHYIVMLYHVGHHGKWLIWSKSQWPWELHGQGRFLGYTILGKQEEKVVTCISIHSDCLQLESVPADNHLVTLVG